MGGEEQLIKAISVTKIYLQSQKWLSALTLLTSFLCQVIWFLHNIVSYITRP